MSTGRSSSGRRGGGGSGDDDLDALEQKFRQMALGGKVKHPLASENLEYWLSKKGGTKTIPAEHFVKDKKVAEHLRKVHRPIFLSEKDKSKDIVKRINKDKKEGKTYTMTWEDSMYANYNTDLFFALGGFTLVSEVKVKVVKIDGGTADVEFVSWKCSAKDHYNWDVGKQTKIPFFGIIPDKEAARLEKAGRAKSFKIKSAPWTVKDKDITKKATVKLK